MYYPIQIPYILSKEFLKHIKYEETTFKELSDFVICFWEMIPLTQEQKQVDNIIIADGCTDLVVDFDSKTIGFSGMENTNFNFPIYLPNRFIGVRFMPGALKQLTGISANKFMDEFLPINNFDPSFDDNYFFNLTFEEAKDFLISYIKKMIGDKKPNEYTRLFNKLLVQLPIEANEVYRMLHLSPRQCQRIFKTQFGLSPKKVLSIIRFQKCLKDLLTNNNFANDTSYYDQSHFINDFKKNIGITPLELINIYQR
ncbi:MAG TPA: AraC family transcriptional regulator [Gallicola sp.]|nr:AraC family transcriptional regulator [Gallicola sp.]